MTELDAAATKRKLAAMEKAGADPAKINEFRLSLPAERKSAQGKQSTTEQTAPKAAEKPAKPSEDAQAGDPVAPRGGATLGRSRPARGVTTKTMGATAGTAKL